MEQSNDAAPVSVIDGIGMARVEASCAHIHLGIAEQCPSVRLEHLMIARTALEKSGDEIDSAMEVLLAEAEASA